MRTVVQMVIQMARPHTKVGEKLRSTVLQRDRKTCQACKAVDRAMEIDHKVPVSRGGDNSIGNLWTLCRECNSSKRTLTVDEFIDKIVAAKIRNPAGWDTPILDILDL